MNNKPLNTVFASLALILFSACSSVQITEESVSNQAVAGVTVSSKSTETQAVLANAVVYFEYDEFTLTSKSIQALKGVVDLMNKNKKITLSLEGHADERGTREYNLALGEKRSETIKEIMLINGVSKNSIEVVSYGEENPAVMGTNDETHSLNRRVEIVFSNTGK